MSNSGVSSSGATLPAWAGGAAVAFDPVHNVANWKAANTHRLRAGIAKAIDGSAVCHLVGIGASEMTAYNGAAFVGADSWFLQAAAQLRTLKGLGDAGGIIPATGMDDRWAITGAMSRNTFQGFLYANAAASATVSSISAGTSVSIGTMDVFNSVAWKIDGSAQTTITAGATNTIKRTLVTGLGNATHSVEADWVSGQAGIAYVNVFGGAGVAAHNLALGGSAASFGNSQQNWSDQSLWYSLATLRAAMLTAEGITPAAVFIELGANDIFHGQTPAQTLAGVQYVESLFPNSDVILVNTWNVTPSTAAQYEAWLKVLYAHAAAANLPLIDWYYRVNTLATAIADGLIGADLIHPTNGSSMAMGKAVGQLLAA